MSTSVALIGLGRMGRAVAERLIQGGYHLVVYNRTAAKAEPLVAAGAEAAISPAQAASRAETALTVVADDAALEAVLYGPEGLVAGMRAGAVLVDMSTLRPGAVEKAAVALRDKGRDMVHAPILGGPMNVRAGNATIIVGGRAETVEKINPLLEAISSPVLNFGELTQATRAKLALNIMLAHLLAGIAGSLAFAKRAGLDGESILGILARASGGIIERIGGKMLAGREEVTFSIRNLEKDNGYFLDAAAEMNLRLPTIAAARELFREAMDVGLAENDYTAIYKYLLG